ESAPAPEPPVTEPVAAEPPAPPVKRRSSTIDFPSAPTPPPLPPVAVRPVKKVTPAPGTERPVSRDRTRPIAADPKGSRRIGWWIGGAALVSVAIAVTLLRPEAETPAPPATVPTVEDAGPAATTPPPRRAEQPVAVQRPPAGTAATPDAAAPETAAPGTVTPETSTPPAPQEANPEPSSPGSPAEEAAAVAPSAARPSPVEETPPPRKQTSPPPATAPRDFLARTVPLIAGEQVWAVHVSSFQTKGPADEEAARFVAAGLPTVLHSVEVPDKGSWIRIYVGPFADRATAEEAAGRVRAGIQEYTMIRRLPAGELQDGTGREGR
ncbi:MAG TPA: SPOR domain-containing protein, partial [bacterium]|nr:SPOR domain-containing protein [bacterium]